MLRVAREDDLSALRATERAAGERFRGVGMAAIADDEPLTVAQLAVFQQDGRAWVAVDDADRPVGYVLVSLVDGNAHVEQLSVDPAHAGRRLGRDLLDVAEQWADQAGAWALTLTTFADVPWNAPYYARLGFRVLEAGEVGDQLLGVQEHERALGLAVWPRVIMRRDVRPQ